MKTLDYLKQLSDIEIFKACVSVLNRDIDCKNVDRVIDKLLDNKEFEDDEENIQYDVMYPIVKDRILEQYYEASFLFI